MSEIEIPLEEINKETGQEETNTPEQQIQPSTPSQLEQPEKKQEIVKDISKLTLEERAKIISDARNGIPNEHYDVILLKNGNTRIVKKKNKTPTQSVASRLISQTQNNQADRKSTRLNSSHRSLSRMPSSA